MASTDETQTNTFLKFLVPNKTAGLIIGKKGATITDLQTSTGATIKVNNAVPGVNERVVIVAGSSQSINEALGKILDNFRENETESNGSADLTVRLLVPPNAAPAIIGRSGNTIKELQASTGAVIRIDNRQNGVPQNTGRRVPLADEDDRHVTVSGGLEKVQAALIALLPHLSTFSRFDNDEILRENLTRATRQTAAAASPDYPPTLYAQQCTIEFYVANEEAGAVIGRQGRRIRELGQNVQAAVARHDEVDENNRRKVTLSGSVQHVHKAHLEILNWLREHREATTAANNTGRVNGAPAGSNMPVGHMMGNNQNNTNYRVNPVTTMGNGYTYTA